MTLAEYAAAEQRPELLTQWDAARNGALTPDDVSPGSEKRVWWRCGKGHQWQSTIGSRARLGTGCPYCTGKRPIPGETDLLTKHPALAAQWHPTKNGALTPRDVTAGSMRRVWWRCDRGHSWQAVVFSRAEGTGCPYCTGKRVLPGFNDLATLCPDIAAEWHPTLNGALTPSSVTRGCKKQVWWQCRAGHVWKAYIFSRTRARGTSCPICGGRTRPGTVRTAERSTQQPPAQAARQ